MTGLQQDDAKRRFEGDLKALPDLIAGWCASMGVHGYRYSIMDLATMLDSVKAEEDRSRQRAATMLASRDQRIEELEAGIAASPSDAEVLNAAWQIGQNHYWTLGGHHDGGWLDLRGFAALATIGKEESK